MYFVRQLDQKRPFNYEADQVELVEYGRVLCNAQCLGDLNTSSFKENKPYDGLWRSQKVRRNYNCMHIIQVKEIEKQAADLPPLIKWSVCTLGQQKRKKAEFKKRLALLSIARKLGKVSEIYKCLWSLERQFVHAYDALNMLVANPCSVPEAESCQLAGATDAIKENVHFPL